MQVINLNQLKLKLNDTYKKDEKITTKAEAVHDATVKTKVFLDTYSAEVVRQISYREYDFN